MAAASQAQAQSNIAKSTALPCAEISRSGLYAMIPAVVRSRIPALTSVRRSAKSVLATSVRRKTYTLSNLNSRKEEESFGYARTVPSSGANTPSYELPEGERTISTQELSWRLMSRQATESGVDWDVASTGIKLWMAAKSHSEQNGDSVALRSMHIDALRYMHMALPPNLTALEIQSIRASMSPQLLDAPAHAQVLPHHGQSNILRQTVANAVCWFVALCCIIFPYLMITINRLSQYEREHQLTEKMIANGLDLTSAVGEKGMDMRDALVRFKDGRLGAACVNGTSWFVESVIGGINDGLSTAAHTQRRQTR